MARAPRLVDHGDWCRRHTAADAVAHHRQLAPGEDGHLRPGPELGSHPAAAGRAGVTLTQVVTVRIGVTVFRHGLAVPFAPEGGAGKFAAPVAITVDLGAGSASRI